jgi:proteasome beta subunit
LILGGWDSTGGHVYSLDAAGGSIPDKYTAGGSGSPYAFGVLEDQFRDDMTVNDGIELALRAVTAAMNRDSASGNGADVAVITEKEFKMIPEEEIKKRLQKMGK